MIRVRRADLGTEEPDNAIGGGAGRVASPRIGDHGVGHMRKGFLGSLAVLATGAGLTFGQPYGPPPGPGGPSPVPTAWAWRSCPVRRPCPGRALPARYSYTSPDGHPIIMPPGPRRDDPAGKHGCRRPGRRSPPDAHFGADGQGLLQQMFGGHGGAARVWAGMDWLWWTPKSQQVRDPLVTTSAAADFGILGRPTTAALCGPTDNISFDSVNGWRAWAGIALDERMGVEVSGFWLQTAKRQFSVPWQRRRVPGTGGSVLRRRRRGVPNRLTSSPSPASTPGPLTSTADTQRLLGAELNLILNMYRGDEGPGGLEFFVGARYFQLERIVLPGHASQTFGVPPAGGGFPIFPGGGGFFGGSFFGPALAPYLVTTHDGIRTFNNFYGGQRRLPRRRWIRQVVRPGHGQVRGRLHAVVGGPGGIVHADHVAPGLTSVQPGGLFNAPQDVCRHHEDRFAILPEGGVNIGCQLRLPADSRRLHVHVGEQCGAADDVDQPGAEPDAHAGFADLHRALLRRTLSRGT